MSQRIKDYILKTWLILSVILVFAILIFIFGYIFINGIKSINLDFLFSGPKGMPVGSEGGIFPAIIGSLLLMLIACIIASILGIATSIYVTFYCESKRIESFIHLIVQSMAGTPSIILGLFGYTLLVIRLGLGRSLLSGGITLGIMIFSYIQVRVEKTLKEVKNEIIEASYGLGISKSYTIYKLVLPICKENIISAITMAGGYAMGASAPIILTATVIFAPAPKSLFSPVMALPFHLYILIGEGISLEKAYGTALVLIIILILLNIFSLILKINREENK